MISKHISLRKRSTSPCIRYSHGHQTFHNRHWYHCLHSYNKCYILFKVTLIIKTSLLLWICDYNFLYQARSLRVGALNSFFSILCQVTTEFRTIILFVPRLMGEISAVPFSALCKSNVRIANTMRRSNTWLPATSGDAESFSFWTFTCRQGWS